MRSVSSEPSSSQRNQPSRRVTGWHAWLLRLALAVGSPLVVLALFEIASFVLWGRIEYPLPGVDQGAEYLYFDMPRRFHPLFVLDESGPEPLFRTNPKLYEGSSYLALKQSFPAQRSERTVRIAFMGGSSVQGWPYREPGVAFPHRAGALLQHQFPNLQVEVINAGVGTYNSFQLLDVADQLQVFNPDVVVIYAGHNDLGYYYFYQEFLEGARPPGSLQSGLNAFNFYRGLRLLRDRRRVASAMRPQGSAEATEKVFRVDDPTVAQQMDATRYAAFVHLHQGYVATIFRKNLAKLHELLHDEDTTVVFVKPASNLRDFPPVASMHFKPLAPELKYEFDSRLLKVRNFMLERGIGPRRMPGRNFDKLESGAEPQVCFEPQALPIGSPEAIAASTSALELLAAAEAIADDFGATWYFKGLCLLNTDPTSAPAAFEKARDLSPAMAPAQRAPKALLDAIDSEGSSLKVRVIDLPERLAAASEFGTPGGEWFLDNIHFNTAGHQLVAAAIAEELAELPVFRHGPPASRRPDVAPAEAVRILIEKKHASMNSSPAWRSRARDASADDQDK